MKALEICTAVLIYINVLRITPTHTHAVVHMHLFLKIQTSYTFTQMPQKYIDRRRYVIIFMWTLLIRMMPKQVK